MMSLATVSIAKESAVKRILFLIVLVVAPAVPVAAQNPARSLIDRPIDESQRTTLYGAGNPLALTRYDQGEVDNSFSTTRVLLMLNRPPEREAALEQYLAEVHSKGSPSYHHWLTPQQFGKQFGPAETDIQTVTIWLGAKGFRVAKISQGKQFIEFSGVAGQLRDAFQAEIHQYNVNGEIYYANSRGISVPTALAAVVRGLAPLDNFAFKSYVESGGKGHYSKLTRKVTPDWTVPNPFGSPNPLGFLVSPEDLATQYDITPLYQSGTNGAGQTIGIIDASNIDLALVSDFQQLFGLASNPPQVIIDGDDPGDVPIADVEAYLDVEISGAIAPKSTINLYISDGGSVASPLVFAAMRAVDDNTASVLSASFGECEPLLGESGNQFFGSLWEQAAAQGQTVMVAAGDAGPSCNGVAGISVSGVASTPWNVAVGGTDFYYSDYATGGASVPSFWNPTNDADLGSLKASLQEQAWNDGFGLDVIPDGFEFGQTGAGGGGASSCATSTTNTGACIAGYPKPSWQTGTDLPADGVRDIPDVSWFASNGANLSSYAICAFEGQCDQATPSDEEITFVGGTSASAPAMAGIMALVNQKFGRQGQADFTFYPLAKQKPTAFHDITLGGNSVPCSSGETDCANEGQISDQTTVYSAGTGYDLATGLGSIDANVLVTNWDSISFKPTTTTLGLSPTTITHGSPVKVTTTVAGTSGNGTPSGDVAILTDSPEPSSQSQTFLTLSGGAGSTNVSFFPGGTYQVSANYGGDGTFGASTSAPVMLTVSAEKSVMSIEVVNNNTGYAASGFSVSYDTPLSVNVLPTSVTGATGGASDGIATGTATFQVDSTSATVPLDAEGLADYSPPTLAVGSHTVNASYSGDASYNPSAAAPITFMVAKGKPFLNDNIFAPIPGIAPIYVVSPGASLTATVQVASAGGRAPRRRAAR
jgi:subtilase family serine protease